MHPRAVADPVGFFLHVFCFPESGFRFRPCGSNVSGEKFRVEYFPLIWSTTSAKLSIQAKIMLADALDKKQVSEVLSTIDNQSIVVSLVGGQNAELAIRSDFPANKNIIDACKELGFSRFIFVTSIGAGESKPQLPEMLKPFLGPVAEENKARNDGVADTKMRRKKRRGRAEKSNGAPNIREPSELASRKSTAKVTPKKPRKTSTTEVAPVVGMGDHTPAFMLRPTRTDSEPRES